MFVWGAREPESEGRGRERSACRGPPTLKGFGTDNPPHPPLALRARPSRSREPPTLAACRWSLTLPLTPTLADLCWPIISRQTLAIRLQRDSPASGSGAGLRGGGGAGEPWSSRSLVLNLSIKSCSM